MTRRPKQKIRFCEKSPPYYTNAHVADQRYRFIDLFCGIGDFRFTFERVGCECAFSSDWNEMARTAYEANSHEQPPGDIYSVPDNAIPPHHIHYTGLPCLLTGVSGTAVRSTAAPRPATALSEKKKPSANKSRDRRISRELRKLGWHVVRFWKHDLAKHGKACVHQIQAATNSLRSS